MAGESSNQNGLNQGSTCTSSPLGSITANAAHASAGQGVEAIASTQHSPHAPQTVGLDAPGGVSQLNYQQGGQQPQIVGQSGQQKPGVTAMRDRQQPMFSSATLQVQQNVGSAPIHSPTANNSSLHRSSSAPRLGQLQHFNSSPARPALYGHSQQSLGVAFSHNLQQQQQQQQMCGVARSTMMGQGQSPGHISMLSGQPPHINVQSQFLSPQLRQKQGSIQGSQFQQSVSSGQPLQGMQTIGLMGSLGAGSQMRASGNPTYQRVGQGPLRSQQPQQQSLTSPQKIQAQNLARVPSVGSVNHQICGLSQVGQSTIIPGSLSHPQQWLKQMHQPTLPSSASSSYQLQQQQRQQQAQAHQSLPSASQQQQQPTTPHQQPQPQQLQQLQQQHLQQLHQQQQTQQSLQQQQMSRMPVSAIAKPGTPTGSRPGTPASGATTPAGGNSQGTETSNPILGKRSIQDLVSQVDTHEKLDSKVEDILLEIADDFIESVTTFACALAKHRKSSILEAKDILLHLERNWHLTIPDFTGEEYKTYKRPLHRWEWRQETPRALPDLLLEVLILDFRWQRHHRVLLRLSHLQMDLPVHKRFPDFSWFCNKHKRTFADTCKFVHARDLQLESVLSKQVQYCIHDTCIESHTEFSFKAFAHCKL